MVFVALQVCDLMSERDDILEDFDVVVFAPGIKCHLNAASGFGIPTFLSDLLEREDIYNCRSIATSLFVLAVKSNFLSGVGRSLKKIDEIRARESTQN